MVDELVELVVELLPGDPSSKLLYTSDLNALISLIPLTKYFRELTQSISKAFSSQEEPRLHSPSVLVLDLVEPANEAGGFA